MLRIVYEYPLPNKRGRYNLSEKELRELLQKAYDNGYNYGYQNAQVKYDKNMTTYASSNDLKEN